MTILAIERTSLRDKRSTLVDGKYTESMLETMSFLDLMGLEFIAGMLQRGDLLEVVKEMFMLAATKGNGGAATDAAQSIHDLLLTTQWEAPYTLRLSPEEFAQKKRSEELAIFDWLESVYWTLPLYVPDPWNTSLSGCGVRYKDPLANFKKWAVSTAAHFWSGEQDELGLRAFEFLCDNHDSRRFFAKAPELKESFTRSRNWGMFSTPQVQKEDAQQVLQMMRTALPQKLSVIEDWIRRADKAPEEIKKFLGHAFVNAGGSVLSALPTK
jgi:hypothetical protein